MGALAAFGEELWLARAELRLLGVPAGRVMTVARVNGDSLWVHSAAPLDTELRRELKELGEVRWVVAPNPLHGHLSMGEYRTAFPEARLVAAPGLPERRRDLSFDMVLGDEAPAEWGGAIDQATVGGHRFLDEVLFHHRPSRTLITGDTCWNPAGMRRRARLWAARRTVGPTFAFRHNFKDKARARAGIDRALAWDPVRLVCGHGEPLETGARQTLSEAYAFLR